MEDRPLWYFKGGLDPSSGDWIEYRDIEMEIIENGYQRKQSEVCLDKYRIDLKEFIQFHRNNPSKQRSVKRQLGSKREECLREERFFSLSPTNSTSSYGRLHDWCPFLKEWLALPAGKKALLDFSSVLDICIEGILKEAELHESNSRTEAEWMVEKLRVCKGKSRRVLSETCIHLYTRESFLYLVLNTALRDTDLSKLETLGPLCFLIRDHSRFCKQYTGTVYRGMQLSHDAILSYKNAIGTWRTWHGYTSTSRNKEMAAIRGNTIFIIEIISGQLGAPRSYDIKDISQFPSEEEVLLPAGISFQIISVDQDEQQKYIIKIKV